ncbi:MAG: hypothetical protein IIZ83_10100 [Oscillospiraceae bacterium]|nr:hypothetical protein [Oscillospiraceae bacterium]
MRKKRNGQQQTASKREQNERAAQLRTQGRKGCKAPRINIAFTTANHDFARVMARATGNTMTEIVNMAIDKYREANGALYEKALEIIDRPLCPLCGENCEVFAVDGRKVIGCESCLIRVRSVDLRKGGAGLEIGCPKCGRLNPVELFFRRVGGKITEAVGCSECISAVDAREWREKQ